VGIVESAQVAAFVPRVKPSVYAVPLMSTLSATTGFATVAPDQDRPSERVPVPEKGPTEIEAVAWPRH
jgi:hypothetical protein